MRYDRAYCQLCRHRPKEDGGSATCDLLGDGAMRTFAKRWAAGAGANPPGHECPQFDARGPKRKPPPHATGGLF